MKYHKIKKGGEMKKAALDMKNDHIFRKKLKNFEDSIYYLSNPSSNALISIN